MSKKIVLYLCSHEFILTGIGTFTLERQEPYYSRSTSNFSHLILQCFFCPSEASFHQLIKKIRENINSKGNAMFEIYEKPVEEGIAKFENMDNFNTSDDEFEIL